MQWNDFVRALLRSGLTQKKIAAEVGCGQATVSDLATGKAKEPRGSLAFALLKIGARCGVAVGDEVRPTVAAPKA